LTAGTRTFNNPNFLPFCPAFSSNLSVLFHIYGTGKNNGAMKEESVRTTIDIPVSLSSEGPKAEVTNERIYEQVDFL